MDKRLFATLGFFLLGTVFAVAQSNSRTIEVDVAYTGSGTVDSSHKVYVALWDSPISVGGTPVLTKPLESKIGTVTFSSVEKVPAYVTAFYDTTGNWDSQSTPPSGSPREGTAPILRPQAL